MSRAEKLEQAKNAIESSRTILTEKTKTDQSQLKLSGFPEVIEGIKTGTKFTLNITCEAEDGTVITAVNGEERVTGQIKSNQCVLEVYSTGDWTVSDPEENSCLIEIPINYTKKIIKPVPIPSGIIGVKIIEDEPDPEKRVVYEGLTEGWKPVTVDQTTGKANYNGWDKTWIFEKFYPVMLKTNGTIDYKLNPNDYSQKLEGGSSDVDNINYDGNAMVCVEKFYTKFSMDGDNEVIQISDTKQDGFEAIGFIREDGSEADKIFLPMFMGSFDSSNRLRSISGQSIKYRISFTDFRTAAQRNGSTYDIETWAMNQIIQAVWLVLMKSCNPKTAIGAGRNYNDGSSKTGLGNALGAISCDPTTKSVKFMHIEDFTSSYSNGMYRCEAGVLDQNSKIYVKMKPPYSETSTSGYTQVSDYVQGYGNVSQMKCSNSFGRYGKAYSGSDSTYETAYWFTSTGSSVYVSSRASFYGVAGRDIRSNATRTGSNVGAALSFVQPA